MYTYFTFVQLYNFKTTNDPLHPPHLVSPTLPIMHNSTDIKFKSRSCTGFLTGASPNHYMIHLKMTT